jgi:hypothetical protein
MTAAEFVSLVNARRVGKGKWVARCAAHPDRNPSLSIREGRKGVMVQCMSQGCSLEAICDALGITVESLFYDSGRKLTVAEQRIMRENEARRAQDALQQARIRRVALSRAAMWKEAANRLGGLLAVTPGSDRLAVLFGTALANSRACERVADAYDHPWLRGLGFPRRKAPLTAKHLGPDIAVFLGVK